MRVDLVWLTDAQNLPTWSFGDRRYMEPTSKNLASCVTKNIYTTQADAWLFWDSALGQPDPALIMRLLNSPDDIWHAGLKLGSAGQPDFIDFVSPTWMLNRDPAPKIEATSWRLSLRCCLVRTEVLRQMGGPLPEFTTLEAASLEMGLRYIRNGVFIRHVPDLLPEQVLVGSVKIPLEDELHFLEVSYGKKWTDWACMRAVLSGREKVGNIIRANQQRKQNITPLRRIAPYIHSLLNPMVLPTEEKVSVLIPTVNRYPYLRVLLGQLRRQTVKPHEILIIDQTPENGRDLSLQEDFRDLPIRWFYLNQPGQCSSRNFGLGRATGNHILFIDDDDEVSDNLIESHLKKLQELQVRVSIGVANEVGAGPLPQNFTFQRISDVFPTGNTMINRKVLRKSGLFDLAYDRGQVEDADLGMRVYLSGERMILNPDIAVLHHHAPQGGLRSQKARVHTYAASRKKITLRVLPSISDIYLSRRYFTAPQVREMLWISVLGTFSLHGPRWKQALKVLISAFALPNTFWQIHTRNRAVDGMFRQFPQIPNLEDYNG